MFTDQAERVLVGEYVREQVLRHCRQEIPYSAAVVVEVFDETERDTPPPGAKKKKKTKKKLGADPEAEGPVVLEGEDVLAAPVTGKRALTGLVRIHANIFVERESQKAIIIGKRGQMLKTIGTDARAGIERLLGAHVFLSLQIKVEPKWTERQDGLRKLGYQLERAS
jgi:GTP-binding protein Era